MSNEMLKVRKLLKSKKPQFMRQEFDRGTKLEHKWVKPRGRTNKMRSCLRGQKAMPSIGYSSPRLVKGALPTGEFIKLVSNVHDLDNIDAKIEAVFVRKNVGIRKRLMIIEKAKAKGIKLHNIKEPEKLVEKIKKQKEETKKDNQEKKDKKEELKIKEGKKETKK